MKADSSRREFLKGTAWMGAAAMAAGCISRGKSPGFGAGGSMHAFTVPPMKLVRVGVIGVGGRGSSAVQRIAQIPGCVVTALSDINPERLDASQKWLRENKKPAASEWSRNGDKEAWKGLCDSDVCDVVYSATPRPMHCEVNVYGLSHGKHVLQEVPGALNIEECWATVEAAEKHRRHCMLLENCTYGEAEMLAFNLSHRGMLGEIMQAEVEYTHDQRNLQYHPADNVFWRLERHMTHRGNYYPTHGIVPAGRVLDINHGDRFERLVSYETAPVSFGAYAREKFPAGDWRHDAKIVRGDINMSLIRTAKGKLVVLKHNVCTPTPYDRGNRFYGTKGVFSGIVLDVWNTEDAYSYGHTVRFGWEDKVGAEVPHYFSFDKMKKLSEQYRHPFWKVVGEMAQKVGGHGGMDFIMDLRWAYCLQNGLPLDTDVYDLATYSSIVELSERSVDLGGESVDFPDYTRGGWKTAKPFPVGEMDIDKFNFGSGVVHAKDAQKT